MLSLKLCLDLLRLFFLGGRQQPKFTRIVSFGPVSMSLPQTISSSGVNPIPFPKSADTPITERLFVLLFWRYLFLASLFIVSLLRRPGWKKKSACLFVFQPFTILFSCFPFLCGFLFSHDTAWVRWFWVFVGFKNGARWDCMFFGVLFYFGIIVDIFAELITSTAFLPHVLCGRGGNVCLLFR